jgi:predicted acetyltransferase
MSTVEIRSCTSADELRDAVGAIVHYFGRERPTEEWAERWLRNFELERMLAALDGDRIVGGAGAFSFRTTVPGGASVPCAGVTVVGVQPTHRRRGALRSMMRAQLDDVHARGEPFAMLFASEETIYGRFGYGMASLNLSVDVPKAMNDFREGIEPGGTVRFVTPEEAATIFPPIYDGVRSDTPGMFERSASWWEARTLADPPEVRFGGGPKHLVALEVDGRPAGYAIYRLNTEFGDLGPETTVRVIEALGESPEATRSVWRFLLDIDWSKQTSTFMLPVDHPLLLLLARPNQARPRVTDGLWVRLVDVGAALSGRTYAGEASLVLDVRDAFCPWNEGRWRLRDGEAAKTDDEADIALDVADLGSVYLGGFTFRELQRAGRLDELTDDAVYLADATFRTEGLPWCPEIF